MVYTFQRQVFRFFKLVSMKCLQCASRSLFLRVVSSRFKPHSIRTESLEKQCFGLSFLVRKNKNKTRIVVRLAIMVWLGIVYKLKPTGVLKNVLQRKHAHINILVNNILSFDRLKLRLHSCEIWIPNQCEIGHYLVSVWYGQKTMSIKTKCE